MEHGPSDPFPSMEPAIRCLAGPEVTTHFDDAARLRISVFREFPYLYDGEADAELEYLAQHSRSMTAHHKVRNG